MACTSPPELDDVQLMAYLDGEADHQVAVHVELCPHCRSRAHRLAQFQDRLTARLYRVTCPPPEELGDYHLGMMPRDQTDAVARHLDECPHCRRELAQLKDYLAELAPTLRLSPLERAKERIRVLVAQLVQGGLGMQPQLAPVPVGIRGEEAGPYVYKADDVELTIEVQKDAERPDRKVMLGLVIGLENPQEFRVHLWQAEEPRTTVPIDELGNFVIAGLAPATYELIVSGPEVEIHIQDLEVAEGQ